LVINTAKRRQTSERIHETDFCVRHFFFCVALYQGWFYFSTSSTDHTSSATITVDKEKIRADDGKAKEKVEELGQKPKKTAGDRTGMVTEGERRD
jgi:hypothetical protein